MNEIVLKEFEIKYELPKVSFDLTEFSESVKAITEQYKGFVVQEDDVASAKKTVAELNKVAKAISDKRIAVAKAIKQPITDFESQIKELCGTIETVSTEIKEQLNAFELKEKEDKRKLILESELWVGNYMIFNETWLNKSVPIKQIETELERQKKEFQNNCLLVETTCNALGLEPDKYYQKLAEHKDINEIVALIQNDKQVKDTYQDLPQEKATEPVLTIEDIKDIDIYTYTLKLSGTRAQLKSLKEYLAEKGIAYEKV